MTATKRFSAVHPPDVPVVDTVRGALSAAEAFAGEAALEPALAARLGIVVEELVANLLRHGSRGGDVHIGLALSRSDDAVLLVLDDSCEPFDLRQARFDGPDPDSGGGIGLELVRTWSEVVGYERHGTMNRLTLRVRPPSALQIGL